MISSISEHANNVELDQTSRSVACDKVLHFYTFTDQGLYGLQKSISETRGINKFKANPSS